MWLLVNVIRCYSFFNKNIKYLQPAGQIYLRTLFQPTVQMVVCAKQLQLCPTLLRPHGLTIAVQASVSMRFSRPEYCSGLPCPPPGDPLDPMIKPWSLTSPSLGSLPLVPPRKTTTGGNSIQNLILQCK